MRLITIFSVLFALLMAMSAKADEIDSFRQEQVLNIIYKVVNVDGYLDQELHNEFWKIIKSTGAKPKDVTEYINQFIDLNETLEYPFQGWLSVKKSYELRRIFRTPELDDLEDQLEIKLGANFDQAKRNTHALLYAAANRTPMTAQGQKFFVSKDMISQVLNGFENSKKRAINLFNPNWLQKVSEQEIPDMNLTLLTNSDFRVTSEIINGMQINTADSISEDNYKTIMMLHIPPTFAFDYSKSLQGSCKGAMTNVGATCISAPDRWRGYQGITANAVAKFYDETVYVTYTGYAIPEQRKVISFLVVNEDSALAARISAEDLKANILFDWE